MWHQSSPATRPAAWRAGRSSFLKVVFMAAAIGSSGVGALGCGTNPAPQAAQASRSLAAEDYYPLSPGWKWAYDLEREGDRVLAVYSVLERTSEKVVVQAGDDRLTYAVTAAGIAQHDAGSAGDFLLKNPPALGAEWPVFGTAITRSASAGCSAARIRPISSRASWTVTPFIRESALER